MKWQCINKKGFSTNACQAYWGIYVGVRLLHTGTYGNRITGHYSIGYLKNVVIILSRCSRLIRIPTHLQIGLLSYQRFKILRYWHMSLSCGASHLLIDVRADDTFADLLASGSISVRLWWHMWRTWPLASCTRYPVRQSLSPCLHVALVTVNIVPPGKEASAWCWLVTTTESPSIVPWSWMTHRFLMWFVTTVGRYFLGESQVVLTYRIH